MSGWILSCGDGLIDCVPVTGADGQPAMRAVVGGSCLNIAVAMGRLGARAGYVGGIATDMFGGMIAGHAAASNVDLGFADRFDLQTTLAFVRLVEGQAQYAFYDAATAARAWVFDPARFDWPQIAALHVGSTTLIGGPVADQTLAMVRAAQGRTVISFDPNCRPALVRDRNDYQRRMAEFAAAADIVRLSDEDFAFLYGATDPDRVAVDLLAQGAALVVLTRGGDGLTVWHAVTGRRDQPAAPTELVDTIGAGDTFLAALLVGLQERGLLDHTALRGAGADLLREATGFAARCAAITCGRAGANPPWRAELG